MQTVVVLIVAGYMTHAEVQRAGEHLRNSVASVSLDLDKAGFKRRLSHLFII